MKNLKRRVSVIICIMLAFMLVSCNLKKGENKEAQKNIKITDSYGKELTFDKAPERIVSLSPGATETIYALNKENTLVGRSDFDDYPAAVSKVKSVGGVKDPSIEKITELKPDLVIGGAHFSKDTVKKLEDLGIKVAVLYGAEDLDGAYKNIMDISTILGVAEKGQTIVNAMKKKVESVENKVKSLNKPKIYYVVDFGKADFTAGGDTFIGKMIEKAGGDNIAKDTKGWNYSFEKIVENKPEMIILSDKFNIKKNFLATDKYKDLPAAKKNKVYEIDDNMLLRQGPRQADGLEALAKIIHTEAFK
ncbi:ABC transporter substrate-binding protein [Clostridium sporogenes]|uniref:ABC transporter substrate-binding protein n=2 Tax=Clostridium TaxID=1485 RepID=A0AAE5C8X6_CLOSG|nr:MULTISPECIES: ABC transporter substrate-binding protein [Clostridium]MBE6076489.1 ABC transporter substrate-binding protein [Clostridium lundense]MDU2833367.1 ABC transporter substrate-binding protein [Clostridium botulinum]EDU37450.1 periplasmic binding protein [Clostridium sporogenes ATCC 15579]KIS23344.1 ABC transporter substrate-binding protein [Clostridium botulinum B2 450]MCW6094908.1 ABC transporter substrate-binding protein [Clostridium sporogenes]